MKAMGQRHLGILRGHRSPEAHASDRGISPGSTGHSRSLGVALPVPNHDESVTALGREGDRLHQLREMGVGGVARSAAGRKPSRTTCRYHRNTERRSARIGQNTVVWYVCGIAVQFRGKQRQLEPFALCPPSVTCISMPSPLRHQRPNCRSREKTTLPNGLNMFPHIDCKPKAAWKHKCWKTWWKYTNKLLYFVAVCRK